MLAIGSRAPDFTLPDQDGQPVTLSAVLARGPVLLYFYPGDFTPVCTREACAFRDAEPDLLAEGLQVIGVSPDSPAKHAEFRAAYALTFTLLSDRDRSVARTYDALGLFGLGTGRVSYRIGADGLIQAVADARLRIAPHLALTRPA
jgi:peroxiredoxin Q/BCP